MNNKKLAETCLEIVKANGFLKNYSFNNKSIRITFTTSGNFFQIAEDKLISKRFDNVEVKLQFFAFGKIYIKFPDDVLDFIGVSSTGGWYNKEVYPDCLIDSFWLGYSDIDEFEIKNVTVSPTSLDEYPSKWEFIAEVLMDKVPVAV